MNIPLKIKILESGISQFQLARTVGISDTHLSKIVNGWITPPGDLKSSIAKAIGCNPSDIFPDEAAGFRDGKAEGDQCE
jgi:DNA-binding XRE family transcriptional regulator